MDNANKILIPVIRQPKLSRNQARRRFIMNKHGATILASLADELLKEIDKEILSKIVETCKVGTSS